MRRQRGRYTAPEPDMIGYVVVEVFEGRCEVSVMCEDDGGPLAVLCKAMDALCAVADGEAEAS